MKILPVLSVFALSAGTVFAGLSTGVFRNPTPVSQTAAAITGDYVEARTASVFCGACHYNSEYMNMGRDAVMAWNFSGGQYHGVSLKGVRVIAATTADYSLGDPESHRKAEVVVDSTATPEQVAAVTALLTEKCGTQIGSVANVRREAITFVRSATGYQVGASGFASLDVAYRTDDSCCMMPHMVWYEPLSPIEHRKVGFTNTVAFTGTINQPWQREGEDSAFYGAIAF